MGPAGVVTSSPGDSDNTLRFESYCFGIACTLKWSYIHMKCNWNVVGYKKYLKVNEKDSDRVRDNFACR